MRTECPSDMKQMTLERELHKLLLYAWFCHATSHIFDISWRFMYIALGESQCYLKGNAFDLCKLHVSLTIQVVYVRALNNGDHGSRLNGNVSINQMWMFAGLARQTLM